MKTKTPTKTPTKTKTKNDQEFVLPLQHRHLFLGWLGLLIFLTLGIALEAFHGFKAGFYLDVDQATRRLMWTLCHVHGTLFALVHIAFACSLALLSSEAKGALRFVSWCLSGAILGMPLGFFLGGLHTYGGDPGLGVLLVPVGAVFMLAAVATITVVLFRHRINRGG